MSDLDSALDTFPKLLAHHAKVRGERPALREKNLGIWQTWTWRQFADEVRALASGLAAQGFKRGDHLALAGDNRPRIYAAMCGWTLARAHARSGDPVAIAAYLGKRDTFDQAITDFSQAYADQNERDYQAFADAVRTGRLQAVEGV